MRSREWLIYFKQNKTDRRLIAWHEGVHVRIDLYRPLARSLATFQLGKSAEGRHLLARACRLAERNGDPDYAEAMRLFIGEEHEHACLLAVVLKQMNAPLAERQWAEWVFRLVRNVWGYYFEITVLLMAEITALQYFSLLRRGAGSNTIASVCDQILYDEKFHIRFHCEYLHHALAAKPAVVCAACRCGLILMYATASAVVAWDGRKLFPALGGSPGEFLFGAWANFAAARDAIFLGVPFSRGAADQISTHDRFVLPALHEWLGHAPATLTNITRRLRKWTDMTLHPH